MENCVYNSIRHIIIIRVKIDGREIMIMLSKWSSKGNGFEGIMD